MKNIVKLAFLFCILRFTVTYCALTDIVKEIAEFYERNGNKTIEWIGEDGMALCSQESLIPSGYERALINASFFERNIIVSLPHKSEIKMVVLKCVYSLFAENGFTLKAKFYVNGMNGEFLRVGSRRPDSSVWTILDEVNVTSISGNKYRITSYTEALNFITGTEKLLAKYYKVYGVIPWRWNPMLLVIGMSRMRENFRRPRKLFSRTQNIVLERINCTNIKMRVLFLSYEDHDEAFVSGLNGEIISLGRPLRCTGPTTFCLRSEVFGGGHISSGNRKLWGVANVFKIFSSRRRGNSGKVLPERSNP